MAQLNQLVHIAIFVAEFVSLTTAVHPTVWRRQAEAASTNTGPMTGPASTADATSENIQELPLDDQQGSQTTDTGTPEAPNMEFSSCPTCWMQEQQKQFRIDSIKKHILKQLKMTRVPNITAAGHGIPPNVPKNPALRHLLQRNPALNLNTTMQSDSPLIEPMDDARANLEQVFIFAKTPTLPPSMDDFECCFFNVAEKTSGYHVTSAKLYFYVRPARVIQTTLHKMVIKMVTGPPMSNGHFKIRKIAEIKVQLSSRTGEWRSIDFTNVVQGWASEPDSNLGIILELFDDGGNSVVVSDTSPEQPKRPFLQLRLENARKRRMKRQTDNMCSEDEQDRNCCLYPLVVDFEQFGWDWIIAPKQYQANYCFGSCPNHYLYQYPHTQLISQMERMAVAGPCCSPSEMQPVSFLMFDEHLDIIYAELPDMAVVNCNCS